MAHSGLGLQFQAHQPDTWPAGRCCLEGWQPAAWPWTWSLGVGRSGAPIVHLVLSTLPLSFSGPPLPSLPVSLSACSSVRSCRGLMPWPGYCCSRCPIIWRHVSASRGVVWGWRSQRWLSLRKLALGISPVPSLLPRVAPSGLPL